MKSLLILPLVWLCVSSPASAATVLRSPGKSDVPQFSTITWKQLRYVPGTGSLIAALTFSNQNYVSDIEPRRDERFDFIFSGVHFDPASRTYFIATKGGHRKVVAEVRHG